MNNRIGEVVAIYWIYTTEQFNVVCGNKKCTTNISYICNDILV